MSTRTFAVVGGGIVGAAVAHRLLTTGTADRVTIFEKEIAPGSGVPTDFSPWLRARPRVAATSAVASAASTARAAAVARVREVEAAGPSPPSTPVARERAIASR